MAIKFGGEFEVKRKPEEVYDFLTDPNKFAPLLPDFQGLTVQDPTHFTVKVNVGISYIKGTAEVKMHLAEAERPKHAKYVGQGSVAGGSASVTAGFDLSPTPTGTKVQWILEHVKGAKAKAKAGELAFGTVDSWLIWNLTGGTVHVTDVSNASRTMLFEHE